MGFDSEFVSNTEITRSEQEAEAEMGISGNQPLLASRARCRTFLFPSPFLGKEQAVAWLLIAYVFCFFSMLSDTSLLRRRLETPKLWGSSFLRMKLLNLSYCRGSFVQEASWSFKI